MSINIIKNKDSLLKAWQDVVNDKSSTDWAIFDYQGQSNDLRVYDTGSGGLEEMIDNLSSNHIMYAFCRVVDTKTSLPKCLLINWQGEGTPMVRKGTCANHLRDVEQLFKGAHITITARSEDDVEIDVIMTKLARATASTYKFNEPRGENEVHTGPVGTTYRRVIPAQEINITERDQFWQREEIEEKKRLEQEQLKQKQECKRLEKEMRTREEKETAIREQQVSAKASIIEQHKQAEIRADVANNKRNQKADNQRSNDLSDNHNSRSEELKKQRNHEAQQLIAQRTINARAIFEQNTVAGQIRAAQKNNNVVVGKMTEQQPIVVNAPIEKPIRKSITNVERKEEKEDDKVIKQKQEKNVDEMLANSAQALNFTTNSHVDAKTIEAIQEIEETVQGTVDDINKTESPTDGSYLYFDPNEEGMKARALYDYQAADNTEITFDPGDTITHIDCIDEGWWQGLGPDGTYGLFPANYVEVINNYNTTL